VFPQKEAKERASQHLRRDVATIVAVRKRGKVDVTIDQGFFDHHAPLVIGDTSLLSPHPLPLTPHVFCKMLQCDSFEAPQIHFPGSQQGQGIDFDEIRA